MHTESPLAVLLVLVPLASIAQPAAAPEGLVPAGATVRQVGTVAEMLAAGDLQEGLHFAVAGYHREGDEGGGLFRYEAASAREPDGGLVLRPANAEGRFLRVFDGTEDVYAEWFGAYGDSTQPHDDKDAINACLAALGRVKLLSRVYGVRGKPDPWHANVTYHAIDLGPNYRIEGSGRDATGVRLLDGTNPAGNNPFENYFNLLYNRAFHESADHVIVRDLTIDCNFDGQDKRTTINAIAIRGGDALIERVNLRGYGTGFDPDGPSSRECFVIHQTLVYKDRTASRRAATLRDLDFTGAGHNGSVPGDVGEITHVAIGGTHNFDDLTWIMPQGKDPDFDPADGGENERNWWPSFGGLIENCAFHDEGFDPATQKSPLHAITYADCIGLTVRGNRVDNYEGTAVYVMSWWNRGTTIIDNTFRNVAIGIALQAQGHEGSPLQAPLHEDVVVERNAIELGSPMHDRWGTIGLQLFGSCPGGRTRFANMTIRNNRISGRAYTDANGNRRCPTGISIQIVDPLYSRLRFEDNTIDIPDFGQASWVPQEPGSMSVTFYPMARWDEDTETGNVVFRGNRTPGGKVVRPILVDWYYKNEGKYGAQKAGTEP